MKKILTIILLIFLQHCSFDDKTGIWKTENTIKNKDDIRFDGFEKLFDEEKTFNIIKIPPNNLRIILEPAKSNNSWTQKNYNNSNNLKNFKYKNLNQLSYKSKNLSRYKNNNQLLFNNENAIISDDKGNIIVYSVLDEIIKFKFNFYKKKYKKIKKNLSLIIENNTIYVADNLGYIYALDYKNKKILWAKNYKIPFRSNIKIKNNLINVADINNNLYFINKFDGEKLKLIPTEDTILQNNYYNSIALNQNYTFFLNTYGSIYSFNNKGQLIWFSNLNKSLDINPSNLFNSNPLVLYDDKIFISTDTYFYILNITNGSILNKIPITSLVKPIISGSNIFLITKKNYLVCLNYDTGKIIYSLDISSEIAQYLQTKPKPVQIKTLSIVNNDLYIFFKNSYVVKFRVTGKIKEIRKLPSQIKNFPIFINDSIVFLNKKNKLLFVD